MNRQIKFRIWNKTKNKMVKVGELKWKERSAFIGGGDTWFADNMTIPAETWSEDVMQFTGLKDKNGVEIYEGDVIKIKNDWEEYGFKADEIGIIVFQNFYFGVSFKSQRKLGTRYVVQADINEGEDCEIIGNIYETPNLIK